MNIQNTCVFFFLLYVFLLFLSPVGSVKEVFFLESFSLFVLSFSTVDIKSKLYFSIFLEGVTVLCVCLGGPRDIVHGKLSHFLARLTDSAGAVLHSVK